MGRTVVQRLVGDVRLIVRFASRPAVREFDDQVSQAVATSNRTRVTLVAIVGDGADYQFDFDQRAKISKAGLFSQPVAVLAPSIRPELVTSIRWVGAPIRVFAPDAYEEACDFLEIAPSLRPELLRALLSAKEELGEPTPDTRAAPRPRNRPKAC